MSYKVLIADDEELLQELYEMILESEFSCNFIKVANGQEAITALQANNDIQLIISDYSMPVANGGQIYTFNKTHQNIPFVLISGGELCDYNELQDFKTTNTNNKFFNKPFVEKQFIEGIRSSLTTTVDPLFSKDSDNQFIKILLKHYANYSTSSSEVYLRLGADKYTKIVNYDESNLPDTEQINHYIQKGIEYVYIKKDYFHRLLEGVFKTVEQKIFADKLPTSPLVLQGLKFEVCYEGMANVGISPNTIEQANQLIDETLSGFMGSESTQDKLSHFCDKEGFLVGHSLLSIYIAARICKETNLPFASTMKRISVASFFHDISLVDLPDPAIELKLEAISDMTLQKKILNHPLESLKYLPASEEIIEETKKIILEHHESPLGDGYPKKLNAQQIAPLSALFILSEKITFCLIRNNYKPERLQDFLLQSESLYNAGNFAKFYKAALSCFVTK